jgi:UDP-2,4-diacetamido-2,4,6-trideoxy-beta-L-altropyranose hydrolase
LKNAERNTPLAVIRADASPRIGGGHVARCLALAGALSEAGWDCRLATRIETQSVWPDIEHRLPVLTLSTADEAAELLHLLPAGCDLLITDHYGLGASFEHACRGWAQRILAVDDLADRPHDADWLLDQTPGRKPEAYASLVPAHCRMLTGADYALLRPEFSRLRQRTSSRSGRMASLLVTFGAADAYDMTMLAVDSIIETGLKVRIDVVVGSAYMNAGAIERRAHSAGLPVCIHRATSRIADLMAAADLCIGACGVTALERCCLGLPSVVIQTADNQSTIAADLASRGAICDLGPATAIPRDTLADHLRRSLIELAGTPDRLAEMSQTAASVCDGRGSRRLQLALQMPRTTSLGQQISLRLAGHADTELLFRWQTSPGIRRFSRQPLPPEWSEHTAWMQRTLADPDRILLIAEADGLPSAMVRLDIEADRLEVSILVAPDCHGRGIGKAALLLAAGIMPRRTYQAVISTENLASQRLFQSAGYQPTGADLYELPPRLS